MCPSFYNYIKYKLVLNYLHFWKKELVELGKCERAETVPFGTVEANDE